MKKNIIHFLLTLTLSFYIAFAPAVAYADPVTDKIDSLKVELQKQVGDRWTLSPRASKGAGVEIGVSQNYPVAVRTTATTAAGAATTSEAVVIAEKVGSKIFTPTVANVAKRFAGGVATNLVAIALYDLLGKAVDYVMDPANNQVKYFDPAGAYIIGCSTFTCSLDRAIVKLPYKDPSTKEQVCDALAKQLAYPSGQTFDASTCVAYGTYSIGSYSTVQLPLSEKTVSFDTLANQSIKMANEGNTQAQGGMRAVVGDMINNNEIDNSYFNDSSIQSDTYNDVTNNYITNNISNQYPSTKLATQSEMAAAAAKGESSVTKTTQNSDGSTTTTTTTFNTTNNSTTNNSTTNNYNITNVTVNNPAPEKDPPKKDDPPKASTPASTTTPTKPMEFPAFCDWAKPVCDFIEWVKQTDDTPTDVDVNVPQPQTIDTDISFGGSCPANVDIQFGLPGHTVPLTLMDWSKFCLLTAQYLKPIVIAIASFQAIRILGGQRESG